MGSFEALLLVHSLGFIKASTPSMGLRPVHKDMNGAVS